ncbi:NAD(P)-binding domain-containing protein [Streptomyces sp. NPDC056367]|uniref:NAD(P)-binding domain-containing protein n=1 Tax=Streptomyces sp. NPDC056367 TaxID=3345797 RepID=UPI0035D65904
MNFSGGCDGVREVVAIGGGQSGLASAHAPVRTGLKPVVLEASDRAAGSWPHHYDSPTPFSPARFSAPPGMPFGGDLDRYPHRDEVVAYPTSYAARLQADIRTGQHVTAVGADGCGFTVEPEGGRQLSARAVVALTADSPDHRPMFTRLIDDRVPWTDGTTERLDALIPATGYRPHLPHLAGLDGTLGPAGHPRHRGGASPTHPGLEFAGPEWRRSLSSNALRGVGRMPDGGPAVAPCTLVRCVST